MYLPKPSNLFFAGAVVLIATSSAFAADLPAKAPIYKAPVVAPPFSWAGFYVGANVGYGWGKADSNLSADPVTVSVLGQTPLFTVPGLLGSDSEKPKGIIGGGQIGYNWQWSRNWVAGLETDFQGSGAKADHTLSAPFAFTLGPPNPPVPVTGTTVTSYDTKISWFGTLRGRLGYAWDRVLLYATGGLAYGEVKLAGTNTVGGSVVGKPFLAVTAIGHSKVNAGWTVGAGIEGALGNNWTLKAEYLYVDLGSLNDPDDSLVFLSASGGRVTTHTTFTDNIARIGLNYRFGL